MFKKAWILIDVSLNVNYIEDDFWYINTFWRHQWTNEIVELKFYCKEYSHLNYSFTNFIKKCLGNKIKQKVYTNKELLKQILYKGIYRMQSTWIDFKKQKIKEQNFIKKIKEQQNESN